MRGQTRILICDSDHVSGSALSQELESHGYRTLVTSNPRAVPVLAREHMPSAIILVLPEPVPLSHEIKMSPQLYAIPLLVIAKENSVTEELSFLANEVLPATPETRLVVEALERYLAREKPTSETNPKSETRESWIEVRSHSAYLFEYRGVINDEKINNLRNRIAELLAVGRNTFTVNLTGAGHLDNLSTSAFVSLRQMVLKSAGEIRFVLPVSSLATSLTGQGVPVDEYLVDGLNGSSTETKN